jgi:hypothetical protein
VGCTEVCQEGYDETSLLQLHKSLTLGGARYSSSVRQVHGSSAQSQRDGKDSSGLHSASAEVVPTFHIDLDTPPEQRWKAVIAHYREELIAMAMSLDIRFIKDREAWLQVMSFDKDFEAELIGIATAVNDSAVTLDKLKQIQMLYEMGSAIGCSGVLWALSNGTVMHGRNMDLKWPFQMPSGSLMSLADVTFHAVFHTSGKRLFVTTTWPGFIGVHTGMRYHGWGFQQNSRATLNNAQVNLATANQGGRMFALVVRRIMETTQHFQDAWEKLDSTKFAAPQYFILSGAKPYEGVVLTIDRLGLHSSSSAPMLKVTDSSDGWHLVQTNDDNLLPFQSSDARRPVANYYLSFENRDELSEERLMKFLHLAPLFWYQTVFSTVMVPAKNYFRTVLPSYAGLE